MMVKIIIERHVKKGKESQLDELLIQLRIAAIQQPGYISGETMVGIDDPCLNIVISTWSNPEAWKNWENNLKRQSLVVKIEALLATPSRTMLCQPAS